MQPIRLGKIFGLEISAVPSALIGTLVLWVAFTLLLIVLAQKSIVEAVIGGLLVTLLYWAGEIVHQIGHARAARSTGYPMIGVELYTVLGRSLYPADEPELPAATHVRRALGGAPASFLFGVILGVIALLTPQGSLLWWVFGLGALISLLVFGAGAFVPLGFTDGSTLLRYWGK
jgi:hypothetical protein